ncbi:MAG: energy transducer TonB [Fidelibacterota bacterium]|nr:MAG: energy transducer TonB [Candidatus Neomarinimicrobiota bacterium]
MKQQGTVRHISRLISGPTILAGVSVLFLTACHLPRRTTPGDVPPQLISASVISFYPPEAFEKQLEGTSTLLIHIGTNGYVGMMGIYKSSGYDVLDEAALAIARTVRFDPGQVSGEAQEQWMIWPVVFKLSSLPISALNLAEWQGKALQYQAYASDEKSMKRRMAQNSLFDHYVNLGNRMVESRSILPNETIMEIVTPPLRDSWIEYQDIWPMAFVLFQDYIERFPDSKNAAAAERQLVDCVTNEVAFLQAALTDSSPLAQTRQQLLNDLTQLLEEH